MVAAASCRAANEIVGLCCWWGSLGGETRCLCFRIHEVVAEHGDINRKSFCVSMLAVTKLCPYVMCTEIRPAAPPATKTEPRVDTDPPVPRSNLLAMSGGLVLAGRWLPVNNPP